MSAATTPITPRAVAIPQRAATPFDARRQACEILRCTRSAALSTLDPSGYPYGSVTDIATDHDGTPIFLMAGLALHTRNIIADNRIALVLANLGQGDALSKPRLTLVGQSRPAEEKDVERLSFRFLQRHPKAKLYLSLPDMHLHLMEIEAVQLSAGPGRNAADVRPADLVTDISAADALLAKEAAILEALNGDMATVERLTLSVMPKDGKRRVTGFDPDGLDVSAGDEQCRFWFEHRVTNEDGLRAATHSA